MVFVQLCLSPYEVKKLTSSKPYGDEPYWINCPSHGGGFDSAGRMRAGPALTNLSIPLDVLEVYSNDPRKLEKQTESAP